VTYKRIDNNYSQDSSRDFDKYIAKKVSIFDATIKFHMCDITV